MTLPNSLAGVCNPYPLMRKEVSLQSKALPSDAPYSLSRPVGYPTLAGQCALLGKMVRLNSVRGFFQGAPGMVNSAKLAGPCDV